MRSPGPERDVAGVGVEDDRPRHTAQDLVLGVHVTAVGEGGGVGPGTRREALGAQGGLDVASRGGTPRGGDHLHAAPGTGGGRLPGHHRIGSGHHRIGSGHGRLSSGAGRRGRLSTAAMHLARTPATSSSVRVRSGAQKPQPVGQAARARRRPDPR